MENNYQLQLFLSQFMLSLGNNMANVRNYLSFKHLNVVFKCVSVVLVSTM